MPFVQLTKYLGFGPGIQVAAPPGVLNVDNATWHI